MIEIMNSQDTNIPLREKGDVHVTLPRINTDACSIDMRHVKTRLG